MSCLKPFLTNIKFTNWISWAFAIVFPRLTWICIGLKALTQVHDILNCVSKTERTLKLEQYYSSLTPKLQPPDLKSNQAIANFYDMNQSVQIVWSQHETVPCGKGTPTAHHEVPTQAVLKGPRQVFVKYRVEIVVIRTWFKRRKLY